MKQIITILLLISMLLSGCGNAATPAEPAPAETLPAAATEPATEPVTEPVTEPTLSAEELFIQSLPEKLQEAYNLGIVDLDLLEDLQRECTTAEAAEILQKVYNLRFFEDSWMLKNTVTEENASEPATRGWFMTMMYAADAEALAGVNPDKDYAANLKNLTVTYNTNRIGDVLLGWFENTGLAPVKNKEGNIEQWGSFYNNYPGATKLVTDRKDFKGDIAVISYVLTRFDRRTGEKLMKWDDEQKLHFNNTMTVQEVSETALRYYNALEPKPDMVPYGEITSYDEAIITPDLLTKETTLPDASCTELPAQWHGISLTATGQSDCMVYEDEVQAIKDAGFNFIRYSFDFMYYHGRTYDYLYNKDTFDEVMNENRLKELDQLLAWCMERDIHLNLSCNFSMGWPDSFNINQLIANPKYATPMANCWKVLAQRYADIPNRYLSFTLFDRDWGASDEDHKNFLAPSVEAVRSVSPDRCMIAVVGDCVITGTGAAELGIALASPCLYGEDFVFYYDRNSYVKPCMEKGTWPYMDNSDLVDGNAVMSKDNGETSPDSVFAIAQSHGVGYMISEWGPRVVSTNSITEDFRYSDETMVAYLTDMAQAMEGRGYGWCYTDWMGSCGLGYGYPLVKDSTYTQIGEYLWIDEEMTGWFREINTAS